MLAQERFICRNIGEGYTMLTINEFDRMCYITQKDTIPEGTTLVSKEIFNIIRAGLVRHDFTVLKGDYIEAIDDKYIWALWMCITSNEVSAEKIMRFTKTDRTNALRIINWMERMGYISDEEDGRNLKINMEEFIEQYGNLEF